MAKVYRKQRVEGVTVPAIIHNSSYFLVQLGVYEDGTVSCWKKCDLDRFYEQLKKGWVTPAVPDGKQLSVNSLGSYTVEGGRWNYDIGGFDGYVKDIVKSINPEMENIYHTTDREQEKWDKARVGFSATPVPFKLKPGLGYFMHDGDSRFIFFRDGEERLSLTALTVYADKTVSLDAVEDKFYSLEEIEKLFDKGVLLTNVGERAEVQIKGLGTVILSDTDYYVDVSEKIKEIKDTAARLAGDKDAIDKCRDAYFYYLTEPTDWARENLRKYYEAVPEHKRCFLGDMDTRDTDYIRILYHPEDKREV